MRPAQCQIVTHTVIEKHRVLQYGGHMFAHHFQPYPFNRHTVETDPA